ncbi:MAG TPA: porin family protein [Pelobium sp.]|nr:porin family protein [Pelobium sp.]
MKKVLMIAFALLVAGKVSAQGPSIGIKGGLSFSNIIETDDSDFKTDYNTGYNAGVFVNIPIISVLSFQPELMFAQKGYKSDVALGTFTQTTNWIEVPILAKISPVAGFSIYAGPQVSFLTKTKNKYEGDFTTTEQTKYEDDADKFKKSIVGGVLGAGFNLSQNISLNARYALDFQKNNEDGTEETPEFKNQTWQAGLAFKF